MSEALAHEPPVREPLVLHPFQRKTNTYRTMLADTADFIEGLPLRPEQRRAAEAQIEAIREVLNG